jgi:Mrp family chromosome partitioning ATPase
MPRYRRTTRTHARRASTGVRLQRHREVGSRSVEDADLRYLTEQIRTGRAILFTGAGFSLRAKDASGRSIPSVGQLTQELWDVAYRDRPYDGSSLGDVYEAGMLLARRTTEQVMRDRLTVDHRSLPNEYRLWFGFPWHRIYTLNVDTLAEAASRAHELPRDLRSISALRDPVPTGGGMALDVVHLNGRLADLPDVTFSQRQYGERISTPDLWYENLVREMRSRPVVFIGTSVDELPLWQYIEARGRRRPGREFRPRSFLLTPALKTARETALAQYNIKLVSTTQEEFAASVLAQQSAAAEQGLRAIVQQHTVDTGSEVLFEVVDLLPDSADDEREFLLGREPRWSDITEGFAIERQFDRDLPETIAAAGARLVFITGTAGSGKSTSAMRLALRYQAEGRRVHVLNPLAAARLQRIRNAVRVSHAEVLLIDDADRFGVSASSVLGELIDDNEDLLVLAVARSSRMEHLSMDAGLNGKPDVLECTVPNLEDFDIKGLLDALTAANRLGALREKPRAEQLATFRTKYGRQLLVAMIEVTTNQRFVDRVESECREVAELGGYLYAIAAIAMQFRAGLTNQELLTAVGGDAAELLSDLERLVSRHLLVRDRNGLVTLRHRVIAERAVDFYQSTGQLAEPLIGLMFSLASSAQPGALRNSRQGRLLIRLINHELLIRMLRAPRSGAVDCTTVRRAYEELESVLGTDYHYWLQRGSFETEEGDLDLAKNFIEQARAINSDDRYIDTAWAYMTLKRASRNAMDVDAVEQATEAFDVLSDVIEARGRRDPYPFHVYGSQGLAWAKRSPLLHKEKVQLMERLREVVDAGRKLHPGRRDLDKLAEDLQAEYLALALPEEEREATS